MAYQVDLGAMLQFHAERFIKLTNRFTLFHQIFHLAEHRDKPFSPESATRLGEEVSEAQALCEELELRSTSRALNRLAAALTKTEACWPRSVADIYDDAVRRLDEDLEDRVFVALPNERAAYFTPKEFLLGAEVAAAFPSSNFEAAEAGRCLAVGCYTACVFHLMRALEIGLRTLGARFGEAVDHSNWHSAIERITKKIKDMSVDPNRLPDWKEQQEFYSGMAANLITLKDAWRNATMHVRAKYDDHETLAVLAAVRAFMQKASTRLAEVP